MNAARCVSTRAAEGGFVPQDGGARWSGHGAVTSANAAAVLGAAEALPLPGDGVVDCSGIAEVDSAAVAVLLALKRRAVEAERPLAFLHLPPALKALTDVYGVEDMLAAD